MKETNFSFPTIQELHCDTELIIRQLDVLRVNLEMIGYLDENRWNMLINLIQELGAVNQELLKVTQEVK